MGTDEYREASGRIRESEQEAFVSAGGRIWLADVVWLVAAAGSDDF
ncbi:MAG: hypothetical protein V3V01_02440 [Acidimicrobiales bacterium]